MGTNELTTGEVYLQYDEIIKLVEKNLSSKEITIVGCEEAQTKKRLVQRIVELTNEWYANYVFDKYKSCTGDTISEDEVYTINGITIDAKTGSVSLQARQFILNLSLFVASWGQLLIFLLNSISYKSSRYSTPSVILMEGGGFSEKNDKKFVDFCRRGFIEPLLNANTVIVKSKIVPSSKSDSSFVYTPHPIKYLFERKMSRLTRVRLIIQHLIAPYYYVKAIFSNPLNVLLGRDISYLPVMMFLNERNYIDSLLVTTSSFPSQQLWMKGLSNQSYKLHMIWYSQNFMPKMYAGDKVQSNLPAARHMRVDVHWVWTEGFRSYLIGLKQKSDIHVVGPILWYLPEKIQKQANEILVTVFDVTPIANNQTAYGAIKNYYTVETITKFISDIVEVAGNYSRKTGAKVSVYLKHKRQPKSGRHDSVYLDFLNNLGEKNKSFKLIEHDANLFGLLQNSELSISVPYTSTANVASSLNKHTIYYDSSGELVPMHEDSEYIHFAAEISALEKEFETCLEKNI